MGDFWNWLVSEAGGTWFVGIGAAFLAWRLFRLERGRDRNAQANCLAAWFAYADLPGYTVAEIKATNSSSLPVYDVTVSVGMPGSSRRDPLFREAVLPPSSEAYRFEFDQDWQGMIWNYGDGIAELARELAVSLTFTDAAGQVWMRDARGRLSSPSRWAFWRQ